MRKLYTKKAIALGLSFVLATTAFVGCSKKEEDKDTDKKTEQTTKEEETTTEALDFLGNVKKTQEITSAEATGTITVNALTYGTYEYGYTLISDGKTGGQFALTDKDDSSKKLLDVVVADNVLYVEFTELLTSFGLTEYAQQIPAGYLSFDINKLSDTLASTMGTDLAATMSEEAMKDSVELSNKLLEIIGKDFPSIFGEDMIIGASNAEAVVEELITFVKTDAVQCVELYQDFATKYMPEQAAAFDEIKNSISEAKDEEIEDEDKTELINVLKGIDLKSTCKVEGEDGSKTANYTISFKITDASNEYNGLSVDLALNMTEKDVNVKSLVPAESTDYTDTLISLLQYQVGGMDGLDEIEG